ncbi:hypothetical protein CEXT_752871 [Caerostris extrusa]|uniref:Thyroglobulin type-1 domain-containing protein n=1 Tax=Caerostris extrusa TaxID=172846 RepID=A0AAV4TDN1_CAEEX|nr:hypothetical protein CEXT_752871 [Caerostris extrusa]
MPHLSPHVTCLSWCGNRCGMINFRDTGRLQIVQVSQISKLKEVKVSQVSKPLDHFAHCTIPELKQKFNMLCKLFLLAGVLVAVGAITSATECEKQKEEALQAVHAGMFFFSNSNFQKENFLCFYFAIRMFGRFVPECDFDGTFAKVQCSGSTGYCYCVDPVTGVKTSTPTRGMVKCD